MPHWGWFPGPTKHMTDLVKFRIPTSFVVERVLPTARELVYGYQHGWLTSEDVVGVALAVLQADLTIIRPEMNLTLLLSTDLDRVPSLLDELDSDSAFEPHQIDWWVVANRAGRRSVVTLDYMLDVEALRQECSRPGILSGADLKYDLLMPVHLLIDDIEVFALTERDYLRHP